MLATLMEKKVKVSRLLGVLCLMLVVGACSAAGGQARWYTLEHPIDPAQLTDMPWGLGPIGYNRGGPRCARARRCPWRTQSASTSTSRLGNASSRSPAHASGVRRERLGWPWNRMSYADPSKVADPAGWGMYIRAFRRYKIRPLILLDSNSGGPVPEKPLKLTLAAPALAGATTVLLTAASAAKVIPGLTGFNADHDAAGVLITHLIGLVATLSRPLPTALGAGQPIPSTTLRYAPFARPVCRMGPLIDFSRP